MSEILSISSISPAFPNHRLAPSQPVARAGPDPDAQGGVAVARPSDSLLRIVGQSSMRQARVRAVQAEIGNGTYETPERINGTVDRLLDVIA